MNNENALILSLPSQAWFLVLEGNCQGQAMLYWQRRQQQQAGQLCWAIESKLERDLIECGLLGLALVS
jgi:hypothetical protein